MFAALQTFGADSSVSAPEHHPYRLLLTTRLDARSGTLDLLHRQQDARVLRRLNSGKLQVLEVPPGRNLRTTAEFYLRSGLVQAAEPDYIRRAALAANDPKFADGTLWGLNNFGQSGGIADADIDAPEAWDVSTSAASVVVAVIDTGIRATHEDLAANVWTNVSAGGYGWNALAGTSLPADDEGHGTLISGVLGAVGNNSKGVAGVAWDVQLMACKCLNSQKMGFDSDIVEAIEFARTNGARIMNISLGGDAFSHALSNALFAARQDGVIVVAAAGNNGRNVDVAPYYPACYGLDNVVSVAFTTRGDVLGPISNYGATNVDLAAPGADIHSTFFSSDTAYLGGSFFMGTSFAAPYVSGALALALERYPGEHYTRTIQRVLTAVDRLPSLQGRCGTGGRLNLHKLLAPPATLGLRFDGGNRVISCRTSPGRSCVIESSSDLSDWSSIGARMSDENGVFEFTDSNPAAEKRFYRVVANPD